MWVTGVNLRRAKAAAGLNREMGLVDIRHDLTDVLPGAAVELDRSWRDHIDPDAVARHSLG